MPEAVSAGRPSSYDEPLKKRNFDLPLSLSDRLNMHSKRTKKPAVRIVQDALNRVLPPEAGEGEFSEVVEIPAVSAGITPLELESTLRSVYTDIFHSVPVSVDRVRRGKLQDLADQFGFASVEDLLQDLAFRAIENPRSAASFLFSSYEESAVVAAQVEERATKSSSRRRTKAA
ncbi:hypothetical protein EON83_00195 [bacterium]|nr:MAG: hypothetical protein EON83_00195 [bacterium]